MQEGAEALLGRAVCTKEEPLVEPIVIQEVISPYSPLQNFTIITST